MTILTPNGLVTNTIYKLWQQSIVDCISHYVNDYPYCSFCSHLTFEEQMDACKRVFVGNMRRAYIKMTPKEIQIMRDAKG